MFSTLSNKTLSCALPQDDSTYQYPADYFKNQKKRPIVRLPKPLHTLDELRLIIKGGLRASKLDTSHILMYMRLVLETIKEDVQREWESFNLKLARVGDQIGPLDLLEIEDYDEKQRDGTKDQAGDREDDHWIMLILLGFYRINKISHNQYRASMISKLNQQANNINPEAIKLIDNPQMISMICSNPNFSKLVAAVDMFLYENKESDRSLWRWGSVACRYENCAALTTLSHLTDILGKNLEDILPWFFIETIGHEVERILEPGQELDNVRSYTPYCHAYGISQKIPYSATAAPGLYTLCHLIGGLLHSPRSQNARIVTERNMVNIRINATLIAFVLGSKGSLKQIFVKETDKHKVINPKTTGGADNESLDSFDLDEIPNSSDPHEWYHYLYTRDFELPKEIVEVMKKEARKITNIRPNTIGHYISTTF
ncbi:N protein [Ekpoma virus 2]|uniref:Nucleoprotein n=1 Tax=Ekpoma virus 2 TaxID=1987021 RepID=A0A0C5C384_9RHAB|nr:N protein [Ekpoma virus 2]AJN08918.1 N protein [Ekpoma virus 2]